MLGYNFVMNMEAGERLPIFFKKDHQQLKGIYHERRETLFYNLYSDVILFMVANDG